MLARFLQGFFEEKLSRAAAARGNPEKAEVGRAGEDSFERMTASALKVAQLPGAEARAATVSLILSLARDVTFPESAAVPVAPQLRPIWIFMTPRRVSDSVRDVLGVRRGEPTGSKEKEPGAPRSQQL